MDLRTVDLFAGCGGLSTGFEQAGFNIIAAYEHWDKAAKNYRENLAHPVFDIDLSDVNYSISHIEQFDVDIIIGGPPCQDFSSAGKRVECSNASLTEDFAQIIKKIKPRAFVMENVDRARKSESYNNAKDIFYDSGYGLTEIILDASLSGVPQKRKRLFCIGVLGEQDDFLYDTLINNQSKNRMTMRDYFGDSLSIDYYYRHPRNYNRRGIFSMDEPSPTVRGVNRPVPKGYPGHPKDASEITDKLRSLTTTERALVQTFPKSFVWNGTKTDLEQMIGNAVPVNLAKYVAKHLKEYLNDNEQSFDRHGAMVSSE